MDLTEIIKSQKFFKDLVQKKEKGVLSCATLFFCEDSITADITLNLCALLMEYPTFDLMNENSAEYIRVASGTELDIKKYPKEGRIVVSDSNEIVAESFVRPVNLPNKIFLIGNFEDATPEAQNKLLKTLEEPPKNVYFFLSAKSEEKVLPTIKSRCDKIKIVPLSQEDISHFCDNQLACILGGGFVGKTLFLEKKDDLKVLSDFAISILTEMKNSKQVLKFSNKFLDYRSEIDILFDVLLLAIEDIIKLKCESEGICRLKPYLGQLKDVEPEFSVRSLCEISKLVTQFREKIEFNANMTVAVDNFLLKILEVKYLCK